MWGMQDNFVLSGSFIVSILLKTFYHHMHTFIIIVFYFVQDRDQCCAEYKTFNWSFVDCRLRWLDYLLIFFCVIIVINRLDFVRRWWQSLPVQSFLESVLLTVKLCEESSASVGEASGSPASEHEKCDSQNSLNQGFRKLVCGFKDQ